MATRNKRKAAAVAVVEPGLDLAAIDLSGITTKLFRQGDSIEPMDLSELGKGGCNKIRTTQIELTHEQAIKFLELDEFVGERPLRNRWVTSLANTMKRGTFRPELVDIITCKLGRHVYRMNGQHTCWARLDLPKAYPCKVDLIEYDAKTNYDMRQLYGSIDRGGARTVSNVIASYLCGSSEYGGINARTITKTTEGMSIWLWEHKSERRKHDADEKSVLMLAEHYDVAHKICMFLADYNTRDHSHIWRAPVIGAMFATINKTPRIARNEFWSVVATGIGIERSTDPRLKLRNLLQRVAINYGRGANSDKKTHMSPEEVYRHCIHAWNAYRAGRDIRILRAPLTTLRPKVSK